MKTILLEKGTHTIRLDEPGEYRAYMANISGEYRFELVTSGINLFIVGMFDARGKDDFHIHTVQHHMAPQSTSDLLIKGVFRDDSRFHYTGLVKIEKGAQQSHAYQKNQNLILSQGVFIESEPFLEIEANDVFCTHGSTTGKLSEELLYYMRSRGIAADDAQNLLVDGFLHDVQPPQSV